MMMNPRVRLRVREFLITVAFVCLFVYNYNSFRLTRTIREPEQKTPIKFVNKCSCDLLNRISPPLKDFDNFPCLEGLTVDKGLQKNGKCVRTVRFPKEILDDRTNCVLLRFGRGTPICIHEREEDIHVSRALVERGMWEEELVRPMLSTLDQRPNMTLLDIGCNVGVYTLSAAVYSKRVVCIDANFENLYLVSKSLTHGKLWDNVTLIWNAISETRERVVLRKELQNVGGAKIDAKNMTMNGCDTAVNTIRLDDIRELFVNQELYIKMDVEGVEHLVLNSGKEFFKMADVLFVQMEFDNHRGRLSGTTIIDIMAGYGFTPFTDCTGLKDLKPAYHAEWPYDVCFIRAPYGVRVGSKIQTNTI